jgi:hypothetical protein
VLRLQAFAIAFAEVAKVLTVLDRYEARRKRELATTARLGWFKKPPRFQQRCGQIRRGSSVRGTTSPKGPALTLRQLQPYRGGMMCCLCPSAGGPFSIFQFILSSCCTMAFATLCCSSSVRDRRMLRTRGSPARDPMTIERRRSSGRVHMPANEEREGTKRRAEPPGFRRHSSHAVIRRTKSMKNREKELEEARFRTTGRTGGASKPLRASAATARYRR